MNITDDVIVKQQEHFNHACEINLPWGEIDGVLAWSRQEMREGWRWQLAEACSRGQPGRYIFYINDDRDYFAFKLIWG